MTFPCVWPLDNDRVTTLDRERRGERYRIVCTGNGLSLIEFTDGYRAVTPIPERST